jgi:hypothetical protein
VDHHIGAGDRVLPRAVPGDVAGDRPGPGVGVQTHAVHLMSLLSQPDGGGTGDETVGAGEEDAHPWTVPASTER